MYLKLLILGPVFHTNLKKQELKSSHNSLRLWVSSCLVSRDGMNACWHFSGSFLALKRQKKNVAALSNLNIIFTVIPEEE